MQRRKFIKNMAVGSGVALSLPSAFGSPLITGQSDRLGEILPMRTLGKTGEKVTIFSLGGSHVRRATSEKEAQAIIETAIEMGVRLFDTAWTYGDGLSEEQYGRYLTPKYRDDIFLYTKTRSYSAAEAQKQLEDSLRRLKTDVIDLWFMHNINTAEDVDNRLKAGVLEVMLKAQEEGKVRHLGFSGHRLSEAHRFLMKSVAGKDPFVVCQLPVNVLDASKTDSFTRELIPDLVERNYGIFGMKTLAHGRFFENNNDKAEFEEYIIPQYLSLEDAFYYVLSQPVTAICVGCQRVSEVKQNLEIIKRFGELDPEKQAKVVQKVSKFAMTEKLEGYRPKPGTYQSGKS